MGRFLYAALATTIGLLAGPAGAAEIPAHRICGECHLGRPATSSFPGDSNATDDTCVRCHLDKRPTDQATHTCIACHDHHPNGMPAQLRETAATAGSVALDRLTRLCLTCHEKAAKITGTNSRTIGHPVGVVVARRDSDHGLPVFDTRGTTDVDDDVIGCLTCHVAHQTVDPQLRRWSEAEEPAACASCHDLTRGEPLLVVRRR